MLFNSISYSVFFPVVFILYWLFPHRNRWLLLLAASYYFYMSWNVKYVFLILFTTIISFIAAICIENEENAQRKRMVLFVAAFLCLGVLFYFKYFNFFSQSVSDFLNLLSIPLHPLTVNVLLPVGISFYTFQTLSYVADVYKGDIKAERHFGYYTTFISFFPQLVAGPIERTKNLLPQIKAVHTFDYNLATYGLKLMAWGFFKKLVIADTLSPVVSQIFSSPQSYKGFALVLATIFFTFQIYCDFSGYSDIAIGTAKCFGINLMANFKSPYLSKSIKEFWNRWHISLSTWFRDYVYIPLGGNRVNSMRHSFNLLITFFASGLWHGANWTFIIWGLVHGVALLIENIFSVNHNGNEHKHNLFKGAFVFMFCSFAWIFFVSGTLTDAIFVVTHLFHNISHPLLYFEEGVRLVGGKSFITVATFFITVLLTYDYYSLKFDVIERISSKNRLTRWCIYTCFCLIIVFFSKKGVATEFVYFQF